MDSNSEKVGTIVRDKQGNPVSPVALAYLGDAVYELRVRESLVRGGEHNLQGMHRAAVQQVKAEAQARALHRIRPHLTEAEQAVVRSGRNTKTTVPKSASVSDYRHSTAFETLIGYLFLTGQRERLEELMLLTEVAVEDEGDDEGDETK